MPNWEQIMAMIDQSSNLDVTEPQIRKQFPKDYAYMKEILYPQLRPWTSATTCAASIWLRIPLY